MKHAEYVCGFAITPEFDYVLLIHKHKPAWQAGYFNGLGGKVEFGESYNDAMVREAMEEADLQTQPDQWNHMATLHDATDNSVIRFYFALIPWTELPNIDKKTDEGFAVSIPIRDLAKYRTIPNLQWLIPLAITFNSSLNNRRYHDVPCWTESARP